MYKRILIQTDGSDASRRAIAAGVELAKALHAEVVALTVTPAFHVLSFAPNQVEPSAREFALENNAHAMRLLDEVTQVAHEAGVPCTSKHAVSDHPFEAIIATARSKGCDVINMTSNGRKGIKDFLLGGETQKVLLHTDIPVLVHHWTGEGQATYKKILVPTDGSDIAQALAVTAVEFARACGSELVVLSVARPTYLMPADESAMTSDPGFGVEVLMRQADQNVQQVAQIAEAAGVPCTTQTIFSDAPGEVILAVVEREQCDLIIMGSHGRHGLRWLLSGCEVEQVVACAEVPVMVLQPHLPTA